MFFIRSRGIKLVLSGIFVFVIQSYSPLYSFIPQPNLLENNFGLLPLYFLMTTINEVTQSICGPSTSLTNKCC